MGIFKTNNLDNIKLGVENKGIVLGEEPTIDYLNDEQYFEELKKIKEQFDKVRTIKRDLYELFSKDESIKEQLDNSINKGLLQIVDPIKLDNI
jgi:PhoPQ-activated pathogenicity-related protein